MNKKDIFREILEWLLVNLIMPIILPFFCVCCIGIIVRIEWNFLEIFNQLLSNGVYTFVGLMLFLSLFQDYRYAKEAFTLLFWGWLIASIILIGLIFISSLNLIKGDEVVSFAENKCTLLIMTGLNILFSIVVKYNIIIIKKKRL